MVFNSTAALFALFSGFLNTLFEKKKIWFAIAMMPGSGDLLSADNLCKQYGPSSGPTNVGPDPDPNCLTP